MKNILKKVDYMPSKSKSKGSSWERDIAKILSEIYGENFQRVPNSGSYTGGKNVFRKEFLSENQLQLSKGDIIPPDSWKFFNCEAKNYKEFPFHHLLVNKDIPLMDAWIEQTLNAADEGDLNLIFIKITRKGTYIAFPTILTNYFNFKAHIVYKDWIITDMNYFLDRNIDRIKHFSENGVN